MSSRESPSPVASVVAAAFALVGFAVAIVAGVVSGRSADSTLLHAILTLACCWPIGWIAGRVIAWQIGAESRRNPEAARTDDPDEAHAGGRTRAIVGTIGPEENPTMRQEVRPRSRST